MKRVLDDNSGQLILIACMSIVVAIMLIVAYEYSTLGTGEKSINRENINSYYYYDSIKEIYSKIYKDPDYLDLSNPTNISVFEKDLKEFALLHGSSVDFVCNSQNTTVIIFIDKNIRIEEELDRESCH